MTTLPFPIPPQGEMKSHIIGRIEFNPRRLDEDLRAIEGFQMSPAYSDYARGEWATCMLLNKTGNKEDGLSVEYEGQAVLTEYGKQVPYLYELILVLFKAQYLKSARIFMARNGFIIPHRDYVEFKRGFTRIHIVLHTNEWSMNSENRSVYHMREGEIWFLDGRHAHSGGSFTDQKRLHLVLDFDPEVPIRDLFNNPADYQPALEPCLITRRSIARKELEVLVVSLGNILSDITFDDIFELIAKLHFTREMDCAATYDLLVEIAAQSGDQRLLEKATTAKGYFLGNLSKAS